MLVWIYSLIAQHVLIEILINRANDTRNWICLTSPLKLGVDVVNAELEDQIVEARSRKSLGEYISNLVRGSHKWESCKSSLDLLFGKMMIY